MAMSTDRHASENCIQTVFLIFFGLLLWTRPNMATDFVVEVISMGNIYVVSGSSMPLTAPAMDLAVAQLNLKYSGKFQIKLTYLYDTSFRNCEDLIAEADFLVADYYYRRKVVSNATVFVFPGCSAESLSIAKLAAAWNQLVILGSYNNPVFRNRNFYHNVMEAGPIMFRSITVVVKSFIQNYNWSPIYVVCDQAGTSVGVATVGSSILISRLRANPGTVVYSVTVDTSAGSPFGGVLKDINRVARVVSFWGHASSLRNFLIAAYRANMSNGDFIYLYLTPFDYPTVAYGNTTWQNNDNDDEVAFLAYQALFVIIPTTIEATSEDKQRRKQLAEAFVERSRKVYNYTYGPRDAPSPITTTQYACLEMLGTVLDSALTDNALAPIPNFLRNSAALVNQFSYRSFNTSFGRISFDSVGDRIVQFDVQQLNPLTGKFELILRQNLDNLEEFITLRNVTWQGGHTPPDQPACGFTGTTGPCQLTGDGKRQAGVIAAVLVIVLLLTSSTCWYSLRRLFQHDVHQRSAEWNITLDLIIEEGCQPAYQADEDV